MSTLDLQEQEQVDALKAWWKENGKWVIAAVVIAAVAFAGVKYWNKYRADQAAEASVMYSDVLKQIATISANDPKRVNDAVTALVERYGNTAYAPRAQLQAAQVNLQAHDANRAKSQLQWVIDHASESGLQDTARLKLASVLLDEKDYDGALKQLDATHPEAFVGLYADLRGDVLSAQGKKEEARAAYQMAYEKSDPSSTYRNLIRLKLDALGGAK